MIRSSNSCANTLRDTTSRYARIYIFLYIVFIRLIWFLRRLTGCRAYGIGWAAGHVTSPFVFQFKTAPFYFDPGAARSYGLLPGGISNEPETHLFLRRVLEGRSDVSFIDVGASIGEFVVPMLCDDRITQVVAFEPNPGPFSALSKSVCLSQNSNVNLLMKAVGARSGLASFSYSDLSPTSSRVLDLDIDANQVEVCTLDESIDVKSGQLMIMLLDIEGGELNALKGGLNIISGGWPLIIFEFNTTSRQFFALQDVVELLGEGYDFFRLRSADGLLDKDLSDTWNVVALPFNGPWRDVSREVNIFAPD